MLLLHLGWNNSIKNRDVVSGNEVTFLHSHNFSAQKQSDIPVGLCFWRTVAHNTLHPTSTDLFSYLWDLNFLLKRLDSTWMAMNICYSMTSLKIKFKNNEGTMPCCQTRDIFSCQISIKRGGKSYLENLEWRSHEFFTYHSLEVIQRLMWG